jgi:hypothetical protein
LVYLAVIGVVLLWPISRYLTREEEMLFLLRLSTQLELTDFNQEMRCGKFPYCKMTGYEASNLELLSRNKDDHIRIEAPRSDGGPLNVFP